jgi:hypothetical protein
LNDPSSVPFLRWTGGEQEFEVEALEEQESNAAPFSWHVLSISIKLELRSG